MDSNEDLLKAESVETPSDSSSVNQTPETNKPEQPDEGVKLPSAEEESWKNLSGPAQERFRQVTRENNLLRQQMEEARRAPVYAPSAPVTESNQSNPEIAQAVKKLNDVGIATKDDIDTRVNQRIGGLLYQMELDKLSSKFDGSNGLPEFDKDEYEDFISRRPQYRNYSPEDVYNKMYEPEILEWKINNSKQPANKQTPSLRPTRSTSVREEPLTPELIEQRLKEPDGRAWYDKNFDKVNAVLQKGSVDTW